jgi:pyruvate,orthophosphate dikinase
MFFCSAERIHAMRKMILAKTEGLRRSALNLILPFQRSDFEGIFKAMDGLPVTIRLLDPPLHEFFPEGKEREIAESLSEDLGMDVHDIMDTISSISEVNPMMGFRGCRLGIVYPELTETQSRAIFEAAVNAQRKGVKVFPEIMVPLIGCAEEFKNQAELIEGVAKKVFCESGIEVPYKVGTMIEVPRAALVAGKIAESTDFFSFGTNDLTQMTFGFSRDDSSKFIPRYVSKGILQNDPFQVLDIEGVGSMMKMAFERGRSTKPGLIVEVALLCL